MSRIFPLAGLALVGLAAAPVAATAAAPWLTPETISAAGERVALDRLDLAVNPRGDAVAVWVGQRDGSGVVRTATRDARGAWSDPMDLSTSFHPAPRGTPVVLIGPGGDVAVAWMSGEGRFTVAVRPGATGAWRPPEFASGPLPPSADLRLAMEPSGTLLAVWDDGREIQAAVRPADTGVWTAPSSLQAPGETTALSDLTSNRAGVSVVSWHSLAGGIRFRIRPPGGSFGPIESFTSRSVAPQIGVGPDGELLIAQERHGEDGRLRFIEVALRPPGGALGPFETISSPAGDNLVSPPSVTFDGQGNVLAGWGRTVSTEPPHRARITTIQFAERLAGGPWQAARQLVPQHTFSRGLAMNHAGAAVVVFERIRRRNPRVEAAYRAGPGRPFGPVEAVAPHAARTFVVTAPPGIDDSGVAAFTFIRDGRVQSTLRARRVPRPVALSAAQLRINQRISQAAVRRANAIETRLATGLTAADIRPGALREAAFAPGVEVTGDETGALTQPGPGRRLVVPAPPRRDAAGAVRLTAAQLRINQRIAQAAVRRANRLAELFDGGLTGAHVADGAIGPEHLAPGLAIAGAAGGPAPAPPAPEPSGQRGEPGRVTLSAAQLRINQRISQAAVRRLNSLAARLERGLPGSGFAPGSITVADLAPEMRT